MATQAQSMLTLEIVAEHNKVTQTIIAGILVSRLQPRESAGDLARTIMELIASRGYLPDIVAVNGVRDGDSVRWV